jgi:hypothetical protein
MVRAMDGDGCRPADRCQRDRDPVGVGRRVPDLPAARDRHPAGRRDLRFVASGGPPNLFGRDGTSVAIGTWIQLIGVLTALVAGVIATRSTTANSRRPQ